jgi:hypothetical protein
MRVLKHEPESGSYMQLCLHLEGKSPIQATAMAFGAQWGATEMYNKMIGR